MAGLLLFSLTGRSLLAQGVPANDDFVNSTLLVGNQGAIRTTNFFATPENFEPDHAGNLPRSSVWWRWIAPEDSDRPVVFSTGGSSFDTVLAVYRGSVLGRLTEVASNDDSAGLTSQVGFLPTSGETYSIAVDGYDGEQGDIRLEWFLQEPLSNDHFEDREVLDPGGGELSRITTSATFQPGEPAHAGQDDTPSVWWSWTAGEQPGILVVSTGGSDFDTVLALYRGSTLGSLVEVRSNDDFAGTTSQVSTSFLPGQTFQVAVGGYSGASGNLRLSWTVATTGTNDDFADRLPLAPGGGQLSTGFVGATTETGEPAHGPSLWWTWTASTPGRAYFMTTGSEFSAGIHVYRGESLETLTLVERQDGVGAPGVGQAVFLPVEVGDNFQVAITGAAGTGGFLELSWGTLLDCLDPEVAHGPSPFPSATGVDLETELRWNPDDEPAPRGAKTIYGEDDRLDLFEVEDEAVRRLAASTVALLDRGSLIPEEGDRFRLDGQSFGAAQGLCPEEPFFDQPTPAWCSGFLVAPDLVATAGHCLNDASECADVAFVFGFSMIDDKTPRDIVDVSDVYYCQRIIARELDDSGADWALVQLDRPVEGAHPLAIRRSGSIPIGAEVLVIGYPSGLPVKVAGGARVQSIAPQPAYFVTNLDVYGGNSGSAVFHSVTHEVEGILVRGEQDFIFEGDCFVSKVCPDDGLGCTGEDVSTVTRFSSLIPPLPSDPVYEVVFGPCGDGDPIRAEVRDPTWVPPHLEPGTEYCWRVITKTDCGSQESPEWRFTTAGFSPARFLRADCNGDGDTRSVTDAIFLLQYSFIGSVQPGCLAACDADGDGQVVGITDSIFFLSHAFLGTAPPPGPYPECGPGALASDADLGCEQPPVACQE